MVGDTSLTDRDRALIAAATEVLRRNFVIGRHHVGAAVRASSGRTYAAVHVGALRHVNTCAERVAIGLAASNGERQFEAIAAVAMMSSTDQPTLVSPCGICREVIVFYGPDITVLFVEDGHIRKARARDLLPGGYVEPELGGSGSLRDVAGTDAVPPGGSE